MEDWVDSATEEAQKEIVKLVDMEKKLVDLDKKVEYLQNVAKTKAPPIIKANGMESLVRTKRYINQRLDTLGKFINANSTTKKKKEYTTIPMKELELKFWLQTKDNFDDTFAVHKDAIDYCLNRTTKKTKVEAE